jgi:hypothetical protein
MTQKPAELHTISEPEAPAPAEVARIQAEPPAREHSWRDLMRRLEKRLLPARPAK